jgi:hypothetical protein
MASASRDHWNSTRYEAGTAAGHYESWFLRANDASGRRAFWIRYTLFAPKGRPDDAVGELWAIAFDRETSRIVAVKQVHPIAACRFARDHLDVAIGDAHLDDGALRGSAASNGHSLAWDLAFGGGQPPLLFLPERLYTTPVPRAKTLVARPLARFSGTFTVDGETVRVDDWVGSQNHNWGSRHTDRYAWGQVAGFDEAPDAFLECSTARLKLGVVWTPRLSPVVLRLGDETLEWNGIARSLGARSTYAPYEWRIESSGATGDVVITMAGDPSDFVALNYPNPPGGIKICLNSKIARCEVTLKRGGTTTVLHSSRAAFEILDDTGPAGVTPAV